MTYSSEVLADGPLVYYRTDEATGNAANLGSAGGSGTYTANLGRQTAAAGTIDGYSVSIPAGTTASNISQALGTSAPADWTYEVWFKNNAGNSSTILQLLRIQQTASVYTGVYYRPSDAYFRAFDPSGSINGGPLNTTATLAVRDGAWHHLAVTKSGNSFTFYIDGASAGTAAGTATQKTAATIIFGSNTSESYACQFDEPALYGKVLTSAQIAAHYAAGIAVVSTPVTVIAPVQVLDLSAPAPVVTVINPDHTTTAPAISTSLSAPSVAITTTANNTIAVPAMALTLDAVAPAVEINYSPQTVLISEDRDSANAGQPDRTSLTVAAPSSPAFLRLAGITIPQGMQVESATLHLYALTTSSVNGAYSFHRATSAWTESGTETVTFDSTALGVTDNAVGWKAVDITSAVVGWTEGTFANHGIRLSRSANSGTFASSEDATLRPYVVVTLSELAAGPEIRITPPAAILNLTMPQHRSGAGVGNAAPVATLAVESIAPAVHVTTGINVTSPAMTTDLTFVGGKSVNPDFSAAAGVMDLFLSAPNAEFAIHYPVVAQVAGAMEFTVDLEDGVNINLTTNRLSKTTPMGGTLKMVGIYQKENDRYYIMLPETFTPDSTSNPGGAWWLQMEEISGTAAINQLTGISGGTYFGSPTFNVDGPQLRKAVRFDGVDDYLVTGPYTIDGSMDEDNSLWATTGLTIEFSIKTTDQNGVVFAGSGGRKSGASSATDPFPYDSGYGMAIRNGELGLFQANGTFLKVRKNIADGEWHHVVVSITGTDPGEGGPSHSFVAVDGKSILSRRGSFGKGVFIPYSFMADAEIEWTMSGTGTDRDYFPAVGAVTDALAGDLRDVVIRLNDYTDLKTVEQLYYEWSNSMLVQPEPIVVTLSMPKPHSAKGNIKKMLAVFGLPGEMGFAVRGGQRVLDGPAYTYYSKLSGLELRDASSDGGGLHVDDTAYAVGMGTDIEDKRNAYTQRIPFMMGDYLIVPVAIDGVYDVRTAENGLKGSDIGIVGADGVASAEYTEVAGVGGKFIDDSTGFHRFFDITKDLNEPLSAYDAVTVVNYPWASPLDYASMDNGNMKALFQPDIYGDWTAARDAFRDSILEAVYDGLSLWIGEYHMAEHLGFIQGWDVHGTGRYGTFRDLAGGNGVANEAGRNLDKTRGQFLARTKGDYRSYPQANFFRRIVATEPGLTDLSTTEYGDFVEGFPWDDFDIQNKFFAYDLVHRPNGLIIGDKVRLALTDEQAGSNVSPIEKRRFQIASAKPEGIVGKVIAREQESYFGPNGVVVQNPYKDNAVTIIAERGTILHGRPITGRVFMEFMEHRMIGEILPVDQDFKKLQWGGETIQPNEWVGNGGTKGSTWAFDDRRYRKLMVIYVTEKLRFNSKTGDYVKTEINDYWTVYEDGEYVYYPSRSMNNRGLNWLYQADALAPGAVKTYAPSMEIKVASVAPQFSKTRNMNLPVIGVMRLDIEARQPDNYEDGNVREKALPMTLNIEMKGAGKTNKVGPMTLELTMPNTTVKAGGDRITVYLDGDQTIKLFLKEDN